MVQTATGATKGEVTVVLLLLLGSILGNVLQRCENIHYDPAIASPSQIRASLESLSRQHKATEVPAAAAQPVDESEAYTRRSRTVSSKSATHQPLVNLNTASKTRLMTIPGIGEATADRILQYRSHTPFSRPDDLMNIKGIGEKRFERMRPFISAP